MTFTRSELEMIYQYAATDRAATVAGLAEIVPVLSCCWKVCRTVCCILTFCSSCI